MHIFAADIGAKDNIFWSSNVEENNVQNKSGIVIIVDHWVVA